MGWNGSGQKGAAPVQPKATTKRPSPIRGLIAGAVVVALAAVAYFVFFSGSEKPQSEKGNKESGRIKEVKPATISQGAVIAKGEKPDRPKEIPYWEQENTNGFSEAMQLKWRQVRRPRREPVHIDRPKPKYAIFNFKSENYIASILAAVPGEVSVVGSLNYKGINEDFLKSCSVPIVINEDDDDYTKELKRKMNETKIELKQRIEAGEDLGKIIEESREELRHLDSVTQSLKKELREYMKTKPTDQDLSDFVTAANKLLEQKGAAPLRVGPLVKHRINRVNKLNKK